MRASLAARGRRSVIRRPGRRAVWEAPTALARSGEPSRPRPELDLLRDQLPGLAVIPRCGEVGLRTPPERKCRSTTPLIAAAKKHQTEMNQAA